MTIRHIIAFLLGVVVAWMARNEIVRNSWQSSVKPSLIFRSATLTNPRAVILEGEFPVCSAVVADNIIYTAKHCVKEKKEGDEVEVLLQKNETPVRQKVYLHKAYSDIAILTFNKEATVEPIKVDVKAGTQVIVVLGCFFSTDPNVYRTSLPYFEREGKVLAVFTAKELGLTNIDPNISPTAKFALIDIGTFRGNSGSGVYIIDKQGKRHLIGIVSAGISDYTAVALF